MEKKGKHVKKLMSELRSMGGGRGKNGCRKPTLGPLGLPWKRQESPPCPVPGRTRRLRNPQEGGRKQKPMSHLTLQISVLVTRLLALDI